MNVQLLLHFLSDLFVVVVVVVVAAAAAAAASGVPSQSCDSMLPLAARLAARLAEARPHERRNKEDKEDKE